MMLEKMENLTEKDVIYVIQKGYEKIQHTIVQVVRNSPVFVMNHVSIISILNSRIFHNVYVVRMTPIGVNEKNT